ncbi:MAG TPA: hypothetical protein VGH44_02540 [Candidatus Saccharimonadia bacterium]|jgi:hypothetical protein
MTVSANPNPFTVEWDHDSTYLAGVVTSDERDWDVLEDVLARLRASGELLSADFHVGRNGMLAFNLGSLEIPGDDVYNDVNVVAELVASRLNEEAGRVLLPAEPEYITPAPGPGPDQHD